MVYSSAFGWNVLKLSMRSISSYVSFKTCVKNFRSLFLSWAPSWPSEVDAIKPHLVEKEMATHSSILAWRISHVHLRRMCILLLLSEMFYKYPLSPSCLIWHFKACVSLLIFCVHDQSIEENRSLKCPQYYCVTINFSFYGC